MMDVEWINQFSKYDQTCEILSTIVTSPKPIPQSRIWVRNNILRDGWVRYCSRWDGKAWLISRVASITTTRKSLASGSSLRERETASSLLQSLVMSRKSDLGAQHFVWVTKEAYLGTLRACDSWILSVSFYVSPELPWARDHGLNLFSLRTHSQPRDLDWAGHAFLKEPKKQLYNNREFLLKLT
jgi:hypothetical protein